MFPTEVEGGLALCLRDPSGLADGIAVLPPLAATVLSLCDGRRTADDVVVALELQTGYRIPTRHVEQLVEQLDEALFLDSPRFHQHRQALLENFRAASVRPAWHAGRSYPASPTELDAFLSSFAATARASGMAGAPGTAGAPGAPDAATHIAADGRLPAGIIAPHIDFSRGGPMYAAAYAPLASAGERPDLVVVFGTDHNGLEHPFTLTRKSYDTPLGGVETDVDVVNALVHALGEGAGDELFADEFHHRSEHSIEFQALWLRWAFRERTPPMVPVLCGSLHRHVDDGSSPSGDARIRAFFDALARVTTGRRVLVVAGADLAHVGPRFGDDPMGPAEYRVVEEADRRALDACGRGDADAFFRAVASERDRFRVCGLSAIYATLAYLGPGRRGRLLGYAQCPADERATSAVSIAAMLLG